MRQYIFIYNDRGVSAKSYQETFNMCCRVNQYFDNELIISPISADTVNYENWEEAARLLIIPGGRETPYYENLNPQGIAVGHKKIKAFVADGGAYLGICAGAYYGASRIVFEKNHPKNEIITSRSLGLYSGWAEGPAYGLGLFQYQSEKGARQAEISLTNEASKLLPSFHSESAMVFPAYFNGGCWFHSEEGSLDSTVLAYYADIEGQPPAIITCSYGKGRVCLSGVHFEYEFEDQQARRDAFIQALFGYLCG